MEYTTLNQLINKSVKITRQLTSGDIPIKMNGKLINIDLLLEKDNNYYVDLKINYDTKGEQYDKQNTENS